MYFVFNSFVRNLVNYLLIDYIDTFEFEVECNSALEVAL